MVANFRPTQVNIHLYIFLFTNLQIEKTSVLFIFINKMPNENLIEEKETNY